MARKKTTTRAGKERSTESYAHPDASALLRPDVGTQAQFRKKKPPATYRYDSSLSPALDWDQQNPAREQAEAKLAVLVNRVSRRSVVMDFGNRHKVSFLEVRPRDRTMSLFAGPQVEVEGENPSVIVFRFENGVFSYTQVFEVEA